MANISDNSSLSWTSTPVSATFIISLAMLVLCIIGAYGNVISVIVFSHRTMKAPINVLLNALSLIDTVLILSSVVVFILPNLNLTFRNRTLRIACEFASLYVYPISMTAQTCSVWTFVLVSLERYLAVCQPLKRHKLLTCREAKLAQLVLLVVAMFYNVIRFWEFERADPEHSGMAPIQPLLRLHSWYFLFYYVVLYVITHFLIPFTAILVLNAFIIRALRRPVTPTRHSSRPAMVNRMRKFSRRQSGQRKTTHMIAVITLVFTVCNTLPFLINIFEAIDESLFYGPWAHLAYIALDISNILVVFNSSSTFVIYMLYCTKYRNLFIRYGLGDISTVRSQQNSFRRRQRSRTSEYEGTTDYCSIGTLEDAEISIM